MAEQRRTRATLLRLGLLACVALVTLVAPALASGQTLHVRSSADGTGDAGTLRTMIGSATAGDTVVIDPGFEPTLDPKNGPIVIDATIIAGLTIEGQGARTTRIDGNGTEIFNIGAFNSSSSSSAPGPAGPPAVTITGLTLSGGQSLDGGGAMLVDAPVALSDVMLIGNDASHGPGGAIDDFGPSLTLTGVTAENNSAGLGGVLNVEQGASATVVNSTLTVNSASSGGALYSDGTLSLIGDTVSGNTATGEVGGNNLGGNGPTTSLHGTIVANGTATGPSCSGTSFVSAGGNLEDTSPSECGLSAATGDLIGFPPQLGSLADNGGQTDTMALGLSSPAVAQIPAANCQSNVDQRALPRPGVGQSACDIGAYEVQGASVAVSCAPAPVADEQSSTCTATVTAPAGFAQTTPTGSVSFSSAGPGTFTPGGTCTLTGSGATATCAVTYTPTAVGSGAHAVSATYGGNSSYPGSSGSTTLSVTPRPTSVAVSCTPAPVASGQTTTCTATVTDQLGAAAGPPAGVVTFSAGGSGTFGGGGTCLLAGSGATASCAVPFTAGASGSPAVTASYTGDGAHGGAGSAAAFVVIVASKAPTTLGLSCSPGTVAIGASTTCAATVAPARSGSSRAPTGSVVFSVTGGRGVTGGGTCALTATGAKGRCTVRYTFGSAANGTYTISAAYSGDSVYAPDGAMTTVATAPVAGEAANISVVSGTVLIKLPSSHTFVPAVAGPAAAAADPALAPLKGSTLSVPMGSTINALKGKLALTTAADFQPRTHHHRSLQRGTFSAGLFAVKQLTARQARRRLRHHRRLTGIPATILGLQTPSGALARAGCRRAHAPGKGVVRAISGSATGLFETVAANSITIVRSALWNVQDQCGGSFTEVGRGHATVTPTGHAKRHQHTVVVGPGQGVLIKGVFR